MKQRANIWPDHRTKRAAKLWTVDGWSASRIARDLNCGLTRNAVIGKMHRMNLDKAILPGTYIPKKVDSAVIQARRENKIPKPKQERKMSIPIVRPVPVEIPYEPRPTPLSLATDDMCRHIAGEPMADAMICGAAVLSGTSWCPFHRQLLYRPVEKAKRREPVSVYRVFGQAVA